MSLTSFPRNRLHLASLGASLGSQAVTIVYRPLSKRHHRDSAQSVEQGGGVSKEVQAFLAHKLAQFLDRSVHIVISGCDTFIMCSFFQQ